MEFKYILRQMQNTWDKQPQIHLLLPVDSGNPDSWVLWLIILQWDLERSYCSKMMFDYKLHMKQVGAGWGSQVVC